MKATKMTLIAALAVGSLLTMSPALRADDATNSPPSGPPADGMHDHHMKGPDFDNLASQLNLTDDQKPKVKAILESQREQMREVWQDQDLSQDDRMAKMKSIRETTDTKLKAVLTVDQFKKFQDMRHKMGPPGGGWHHDDNPPTAGNTPPQS